MADQNQGGSSDDTGLGTSSSEVSSRRGLVAAAALPPEDSLRYVVWPPAKPRAYSWVEVGGDRHPDLATAQAALLVPLVDALLELLRNRKPGMRSDEGTEPAGPDGARPATPPDREATTDEGERE